MKFMVAFFLAFGSVSAWAKPILWTLQGFTFSDGGTAFGSFVYDADTNTYSNLNITTTAGSARGGATYTVVNPNVGHTASGFLRGDHPFVYGWISGTYIWIFQPDKCRWNDIAAVCGSF